MAFKLVAVSQADTTKTPVSTLSNEALVAEYDRLTALLKEETDLFSGIDRSQQAQLLKQLEIEGNKRQILYFLEPDELLTTCKQIFDGLATWAK